MIDSIEEGNIMSKKGRFKLPRTMWTRSPVTRVVPNKKAKISKEICRKWRQYQREFIKE